MSTARLSEPDDLAIALRVFAVRCVKGEESIDDLPRRSRRSLQRHLPHRVLVFDTETTTDESQRFNFGNWRYFVDRYDRTPGVMCVEEGIVYADDLPERDPEAYARLVEYVATASAHVAAGFPTSIRLLSRSEFVEEILWKYGYKQRAHIVGFNLPFDLSRLAIGAADARGRFAGGISLRFWEDEHFRPRIAHKTIDAKRQLIGFTKPAGDDERFRGHFLDLHTLCFALSDLGGNLETCCAQFGVHYTKRHVVHGTVTDEYISYCREDVAATAALFRATMFEYALHPIALQPTKAFSPASIGKAYLRAMGIRPILERFPDFAPEILGYSMAAFFGGRAECRIRKVPVPVIYVDFLSMYSTVNALMGSWRLLTAKRIEIIDVTEHVRRLVTDRRLFARCFTPRLWPELLTLVEIQPDGDLVPVRARYDPASHDYGIGLNPYWLEATAWYSLADVLTSVILTGKQPKIVRALRLCATGRQPGLRPVELRGTVKVDPHRDDFFRLAIEERHRTLNTTISDEERARLSQFLKTIASATGYGINAEYVRREQSDDVAVHVFSDTTFDTAVRAPEDPGEYCFPPLAACITGAARLMLAILQRSVTDLGGSYVFCDTDSMAIVATEAGGLVPCPGGPCQLDDSGGAVRALSRAEVISIVERFSALNSYNRDAVPGSILKFENENYDENGDWQPLWCWSIAAKRYCLYILDDRNEPIIVKASEHGLGHLLNPTDPDDESRTWIIQTWTYLLRCELGLPAHEPDWFDRMALSRITVSTPTILHWFDAINDRRAYTEQIKPANFMLVAHPQASGCSPGVPIAPYESDPRRWLQLHWIDRRTGQTIDITTERFDGYPRPDLVHIRTYRDIIAAYLAHPETKSLAPDGTPCRGNTRGLLQHRPVRGVLPAHYIGKEANRIDDRTHGLVDDADEYRTEYTDPTDPEWAQRILPVLASIARRELAQKLGVDRGTVTRWFNGVQPHQAHRDRARAVAVEHATIQLREHCIAVPRVGAAIMQRYLDLDRAVHRRAPL
jgi:hypothetical protein